MPSTSPATKKENQVREGEIRLAAFTAEHNAPFTIMDHMPKLLVTLCLDSSTAKKNSMQPNERFVSGGDKGS